MMCKRLLLLSYKAGSWKMSRSEYHTLLAITFLFWPLQYNSQLVTLTSFPAFLTFRGFYCVPNIIKVYLSSSYDAQNDVIVSDIVISVFSREKK